MDKREFIKTLFAGIAGTSLPAIPAGAKEEYIQEEKEKIMCAAMDSSEGKKALKKIIDECDLAGRLREMMVKAAGSEEEYERLMPLEAEDLEINKMMEERLGRVLLDPEDEWRKHVNKKCTENLDQPLDSGIDNINAPTPDWKLDYKEISLERMQKHVASMKPKRNAFSCNVWEL